jgi:putative membrane protein
MTTLFAALHHGAVLALVACALFTLHHLWQPFTLRRAQALRKADMLNGLAATLVLVVGLIRVFYLEKGAAYYFGNGPFIAKMGLYGVASLLSLVPTLELRRWRAALQLGQLPVVADKKRTALRTVACLQLACLVGMAVCGSLAAGATAGYG